mmetsp:Transcript_3982/g.9389  ORF Transcript_3982/g.9389 Transcript_3982/m.9389 type:complete len:297 (-) Transcript_3982:1859-2749(-)
MCHGKNQELNSRRLTRQELANLRPEHAGVDHSFLLPWLGRSLRLGFTEVGEGGGVLLFLLDAFSFHGLPVLVGAPRGWRAGSRKNRPQLVQAQPLKVPVAIVADNKGTLFSARALDDGVVPRALAGIHGEDPLTGAVLRDWSPSGGGGRLGLRDMSRQGASGAQERAGAVRQGPRALVTPAGFPRPLEDLLRLFPLVLTEKAFVVWFGAVAVGESRRWGIQHPEFMRVHLFLPVPDIAPARITVWADAPHCRPQSESLLFAMRPNQGDQVAQRGEILAVSPVRGYEHIGLGAPFHP